MSMLHKFILFTNTSFISYLHSSLIIIKNIEGNESLEYLSQEAKKYEANEVFGVDVTLETKPRITSKNYLANCSNLEVMEELDTISAIKEVHKYGWGQVYKDFKESIMFRTDIRNNILTNYKGDSRDLINYGSTWDGIVAHKFNVGYDEQLLELYNLSCYNISISGLEDVKEILNFIDKYQNLVIKKVFFIVISSQECYVSTAEEIEGQIARGNIVRVSIEDILDVIKLCDIESIDWVDLFTTGCLTF